VYTQNANECANSVIMRFIEEKCSVSEFVGKMRELIKQQENDLETATLGISEAVELLDTYAHLRVSQSKFFNRVLLPGANDRKKVLKLIHDEPLRTLISDELIVSDADGPK
jgi:bisphosphoglycerate-dependent phosphoglycerate mutase